MNEEKHNRFFAAVTVNAIILIVILVAVIIYQLVNYFILDSRRDDLTNDIEFYTLEALKAENSLDYYKSYDYLLDKAFEKGFIFGK